MILYENIRQFKANMIFIRQFLYSDCKIDVNGCGSGFTAEIPFAYRGLVTSSCNKHDVCYDCVSIFNYSYDHVHFLVSITNCTRLVILFIYFYSLSQHKTLANIQISRFR